MRNFLRAHWKAIVAILLLIGLAAVTVNTSSAMPDPPLAARLRAHAVAIASASAGQGTATPRAPGQAALYIENVLGGEGYRIRRQACRAGGQAVCNIEVSVANVAPGARPARIFIIGARYAAAAANAGPGADAAGDPNPDPNPNPESGAPGTPGADDDRGGSGIAAVLELARLLKDMRPSRGTEVKFVFLVNEEAPWSAAGAMGPQHARHGRQSPPGPDGRHPGAGGPDTGSFIAFAGTLASSRLVQDALSAFQAASGVPARGLAAPAYVRGVTLSDHGSYARVGYPAIMITDTAFLRYPYYPTAEDTPEQRDYDSVARVVAGLAKTVTALAAGAKA